MERKKTKGQQMEQEKRQRRGKLRAMFETAVLAAALTATSTEAWSQVENHDIRVGNTYYQESDFNNAEKKYRSAVSKRSDSYGANYNLGNALYRKQDWQTAREHYKHALGLARTKKDRAQALHNIGCTYLQEKKYQEAAEQLKKSMQENPESEKTRKQLAYAMRMAKKEQKQNPPPNAGDKMQKDEDMSQDKTRQLLEALDQDEENKKPNYGEKALIKNW